MSNQKMFTELELDQVVKQAREDELYQTLKILKKLGVIDETAMTKMALEGYWRQGESLRRVELSERHSVFDITRKQQAILLSIALGLVAGIWLVSRVFGS